MQTMILPFVLGTVFLVLLFLFIKWIRRRKIATLLNRYQQGIIQENEYHYEAALEIYKSILEEFENTKMGRDPLLQKIRERLKTLQLQIEFQNSRS